MSLVYNCALRRRIVSMANSVDIIKFFCCILIAASHIGNIIPKRFGKGIIVAALIVSSSLRYNTKNFLRSV